MKAREWKATSPQDTFRLAKIMGKNKLAASRIRKRYLREWIADCEKDGSDIARLWAAKAREEIKELEAKEGIEFAERRSPDRITDEMIEEARSYPANKLVEWNRTGNATAWCHMDAKPSLAYMNRINKLWCPVCDKYFDSIAVLMGRDGMSFKDAVKELST